MFYSPAVIYLCQDREINKYINSEEKKMSRLLKGAYIKV